MRRRGRKWLNPLARLLNCQPVALRKQHGDAFQVRLHSASDDVLHVLNDHPQRVTIRAVVFARGLLPLVIVIGASLRQRAASPTR